MKVNIYYGGRGLIEDPTIYVMNKLTEVLEEIRVEVQRYNLFEEKNSITMLPKTLKEADGVILATNVEWLGIGGLMHQFLDACWLYADKKRIKGLYMMPVVLANTYGEREAELTLKKAWELLGGSLCHGISAYVEDHVEFETNVDYAGMIEKRAEDLYRAINQKAKSFPSSNNSMNCGIINSPIELTPQESEQLSMYISDDTYVKKQKEDIEELTQIFKQMLDSSNSEQDNEFIKNFRENFHPVKDFSATYAVTLAETNKSIIIEINEDKLNCYYGIKEDADVSVKASHDVISKLIKGKITFQSAFMSGVITAKGDFKALRTFDEVFQFNK